MGPMLNPLSGASFFAENRVHFSLTRTSGSARCASLGYREEYEPRPT
jgi:hypothetical protein